MSTKQAEIIIGSDNYFHRKFSMPSTLARKRLLAHVLVIEPEAEFTYKWMFNDMKALGIIALGIIAIGVSLKHQTKI